MSNMAAVQGKEVSTHVNGYSTVDRRLLGTQFRLFSQHLLILLPNFKTSYFISLIHIKE